MRKPDLFKPDNSHEFPEPVSEGFRSKSLHGLPSSDKDVEPTVYIFEDSKSLYSSLVDHSR